MAKISQSRDTIGNSQNMHLRRRSSCCFRSLVAIVAGYLFFCWVDSGSIFLVPIEHEAFRGVIFRSANGNPQCRYNGNCPTGQSCRGGVCIPYMNASLITLRPAIESNCAKTCLKELKADEWYYQDSIPIVQGEYLWDGGCIIEYKRQQKDKAGKDWEPPSLEEWMQQRYRYVLRTDPAKKIGQKSHSGWIALCASPCKSNRDCPSDMECLGRPESDIPPAISTDPKTCSYRTPDRFTDDMMIVSGSNSRYFDALENFAASLKFWAPGKKLAVYNLGMSQNELGQVSKWPNVHRIHWRDGFPSHFPPHVENLHNYAWKSLAINESVHEYKSMFWLDAGATFTGPIDPIQEIVHRDGIFLVKGQDANMKDLSSPSTYKWFGFEKETFHGGPHFAGGIQGHVYPSRYIESIVLPNAECAMDKNCIEPEGASLMNHRFDQTSLSILSYQHHLRPQHHTEHLAAGRHRLNDDMKIPNRVRVWTARGSCYFYSDMKELLAQR